MTIKTVTVADLKMAMARLEAISSERIMESEQEELAELQKLKRDLFFCWDQDHTRLIASEDFTEFAMDFLYQIGDLKKGGIADNAADHDKLSEVVEQDYMDVTYDKSMYFVRRP